MLTLSIIAALLTILGALCILYAVFTRRIMDSKFSIYPVGLALMILGTTFSAIQNPSFPSIASPLVLTFALIVVIVVEKKFPTLLHRPAPEKKS